MKGKWAAGIAPRNFVWVIRDQLAASERPGGYARNHRRIRRQEEIIWVREQGFTRVVSLLPSHHNLHAYEEMGMPYEHVPFSPQADARVVLGDLYSRLKGWLDAGERVLLHQDDLGDVVQGTLAGYLVHAGLISSGAQAIAILEKLTHRPMGPTGRQLVAVTSGL